MKKYFIKINKEQRKNIANIFVSSFLLIGLFFSPLLPLVGYAEAAFNKQINYQGKLTTSANIAVANGTYNMEFKLYDSGSTLLWTETRTGANKVTVSNGLFSVLLGEVNALTGVDFNQTLYLGVNIGGTGTPGWDGEMTPRKKLGAVPAAVVSETTSNLFAGTAGSLPYQSAANTTAFTAAGTTGQALISGGTGSPTWFAPTSGSILFGGASGILSQDNANFFWNSTTHKLGIGTTAPGELLTLGTAGTTAGSISLAGATSGKAIIVVQAAAGTPTLTLPTTTGTFALTSDITTGLASYVPYTGATSDLNLGTHTITSGLINSQTISSAASFTGTVTAATSFLAPTFDTATGVAMNIGTATQTGLTLGRVGATTTINGSTITAGGATTTAFTLGNVTSNPTLTLLGTGLTTLGGGLTVTGTSWTATPTISGLITATSGLTSNGTLTVGANQNLTMTSGTGVFAQTFTGTTTNANTITANSLTTGSGFVVNTKNTATTNTPLSAIAFNITEAQSTIANSGVTGLAINFTNNPTIAGNTGSAVRIQNQLTANTIDNSTDSLLLLDNADTSASGTTVVTNAIKITNTGGAGYTNFLNTPTVNITAAGVISGATGITTSNALTLSTAPTTSASTYDILTRNTSTGVVEKVISSTFLTSSTGVSSITGTANQITASASTGAVTLSVPADFRAPGTLNAVTSIATGAGAGTVRIDASGNLSNIGTISSGLINSQTISSAASFTGTVTAATSFLAPTFDTATGVAMNIGTATQTGLTLGRVGATTTINGSTITAGGATTTAFTLGNVTSNPTLTLLGTGLTTLGGGLTVAGAVTLTTDLTVPNGGTGVSTFTSNGVLYGNAAGSILATAQGAANTVLVANAGAPSFSSAINVGTSVSSPIFQGISAATTFGNASYGTTIAGSSITVPFFTSAGFVKTSAAGVLSVDTNTYLTTTTAGTTYIPYTGGTSNVDLGIHNLKVDTDTLFVDATNHKLGIGTTIPRNTLDVNTHGFSNLASIEIGAGYDSPTNVGITFYRPSGVGSNVYPWQIKVGDNLTGQSGDFYFMNSPAVVKGSETYTSRLTIKANGNLGIGTTAPSGILSLDGTAARTIWMERNTTAATAGLGLTLSSGGAIAGTADLAGGDLTLKSGISTGTGASALRFFTATSQGSTNTTDNTPTEKMTILGNGNVGVGTVGPGAKFSINQGSYGLPPASGSTPTGGFRLSADGGGNVVLDMGVNNVAGSGAWIQANLRTDSTTYPLLLNPNGGNVGIGTTNPGAALSVVGSTANDQIILAQNTNANGISAFVAKDDLGTRFLTFGVNNSTMSLGAMYGLPGEGIFRSSTSATGLAFSATTGPIRFLQTGSGTERMRISSSGFIGIANTNPSELLTLGTAGTTAGSISLAGATSGKAIIVVQAAAGTPTLTLPTTTGTLALLSDVTGGFIPYTGGTSNVDLGLHNLKVDTNTLFVDATNHEVGIGTTAPGSKLGVLGNASIGATYGAIAAPTSGLIVEGNVGVGTTSPLSLLNAQGTNTAGILTLSNSAVTVIAGDSMGQLNFYTNDASTLPNRVVASIKSIADQDYVGSDVAATSLSFLTHTSTGAATEKFRILGNGNIGIGTSSPTNILSLGNTQAQKLWIENTVTDVVGRALTVAAGSTVAGTSVSDVTGGNLILQSGLGTGTGASTISFQTGTTLTTGTALQTMSTKMTILGNGNVGVGVSNPGNLLTVANSVSDTIPALGVNGGKFSILNGLNYGLLAGVLSSGNVFMQAQRIDATATVYNILLQPNGGYVGIGLSTNPGYPLDVNGVSAARTYFLAHSSAGGSGLVIQNNGAGANLAIAENAAGNYSLGSNASIGAAISPVLTWTSGGSVGVGTTAPSSKLEVMSGSVNTEIARFTNTTTARGLTITGFAVNGTNEVGYNFNTPGAGGNAALSFSTLSAEAMRINSSGYVGIGTTNPSALFSVGLTSQFQVNTSGAIAAATGITSSGTIKFSGLTASKVVFTDASSNLTSTGIGTSSQFIKGDGSLDSNTYLTSSTGVSSITGTANQITASASTGAVTLSVPADFRAPGTLNAVTSIATGAGAGTVRIDASGNLSNIGTISSGLINSQTISSAASFTGTVTAATSFSSPIFQGIAAATTFGNASYNTAITSNVWGITAAGVASGLTGITSSGTITGGSLVEKKVTFTPTTVGWYRIASANGPFNADTGGIVRIVSGYDNKVTDVELSFDIGGYGVGGSIQETLYSSYNSGAVSQARISSDGANGTYLDIYISSATVPGPVSVYAYGPNMGTLTAAPVVGAVAGSTNVNILTLGHGFRTTSSLISVGVDAGTGLIQNTGGATISGAAINLNANSNFAVNLATGTSTGTITLGGTGTQSIDIGAGVGVKTITIGNANDDTFSINSSAFDVSTTGALSGITTVGMSGQLTSTLATGTSPFNVTSTTLNTNLNADLLDGQHGSYYATASSLGSYLPLAGGTMTGTINSTATEALRMNNASAYISAFNGDNTTRNGYIQFVNGHVDLESEQGTKYLLLNAYNGGNVGIGTTNPVNGKLEISGTNGPALYIGNGGDLVISSQTSGANSTLYNDTGTLNLTTPFTVTGGSITTSSQLVSVVSTGTSPLSVSSSTLNTNLNADMLDGLHSTSFMATPSGTLNYVAKFTGTGTTIGNSLIFDNGTNVGISTAGPGAKFSINQVNYALPPTSGSTPTGGFRLSADTGGNIVLDMGVNNTAGSGAWIQSNLRTDSTAYPLLLNPNGGNVGIGTTAPSYKLTVVDGANNTSLRVSGTNTGAAWAGRIVAGGASNVFIMGQYNNQAWLGAHNTALSAWSDFYISPDGNTQRTYIGTIGGVAGGPALTVQNSNGNVGIGTTAPSQKLEVAGNMQATGGYFTNLLDSGLSNLIRNGSIENGTTYWGVMNDTGSNGTVTAYTADSYSGPTSLRYTISTRAGWGSVWFNTLNSYLPTPYFDTNKTYTLSFYVKSLSGSSTNFGLSIMDSNGINQVTDCGSKTATTSWTQVTCTFTPAVAGNTPFLYMNGSVLPMDILFDNFVLTTGSQAFGYAGLQMDRSDSAYFNSKLEVSGLTRLGNINNSTNAAQGVQVYTGNTANSNQGIDVIRGTSWASPANLFGMHLMSDGSGNYRGALGLGTSAFSEQMTFLTNGSVGIGTTNPGGALDVRTSTATQAIIGITTHITGTNYGVDGEATGSGATANYGGYFAASGATSNYAIGIPANYPAAGANNFAIYSASQAKSYFTGNVGIGTTIPGNKLSVKGAMDGSYPIDIGQINIAGSDSMAINKGGLLSFSGSYTGTTETTWASIGGLKENSTDGNYSGYLGFYTRLNGSTNTEKMRITSGGSVGIGTTNPGAKLSVGFGNLNVGEGANTNGQRYGLNVYGYDAGNSYSGSLYSDYTDSMKTLHLYSTNMSQIKIDSSSSNGNIILFPGTGNVGIGTTAPGAALDVNGSVRANGWYKWDVEAEWHTNDAGGSPHINKDEVAVTGGVTPTRGINTYVFDKLGNLVTSWNNDVYGTPSLWDTWATAVNARNNGEVIIVISQDAISDIPFGGAARTLLNSLGSKDLFEIPGNGRYGVAFAFIKGNYGIIEKIGRNSTERGMIRFNYQDLLVMGDGKYSYGTADINPQSKSIYAGNALIANSLTTYGNMHTSDISIDYGNTIVFPGNMYIQSSGKNAITDDNSEGLQLDPDGSYGKVMVGDFANAHTSNLLVNGNIGIGTTNPTANLTVANGAIFGEHGMGDNALEIDTTGQIISSAFYSHNTDPGNHNGGITFGTDNYSIYEGSDAKSNGMIFSDSSSGGLINTTDSLLSLYPDRAIFPQNVGIGTTGPGNKLTVTLPSIASVPALGANGGHLGLLDASGFGLIEGLLTNGNAYLQVQRTDATLNVYDMLLQPNGGNVGIGTTAPEYQLEVVNPSTSAMISVRGYGTGNSTGGGFYGRAARGTVSSPSALQNDDLLLWFGGRGYGSTGWLSSKATMAFYSAGTWTDTSSPTYISFGTTPSSSVTRSERMRIDSAGNIGIGTTNPAYILTLGGTAARTFGMERNTTAYTAGQGLTISSGGSYQGGSAPDLAGGDLVLKSGISTGTASSALRFFTATAGTTGTTDRTPTEKMTILGNGNVGIGITAPNDKLDVVGYARIGASTEKISMGSQSIGFNRRVETGTIFDSNAYAYQFQHTQSTTQASDYLALQIYNTAGTNVSTNALVINGSGNVGVGTTNPATKLDIKLANTTSFNRAVKIEQSNYAVGEGTYMEFASSGTDAYGAQIGGIKTGTNGENALVIRTGLNSQTERMRITDGGLVGISTTNPLVKFQIGADNVTEPITLGSLTPSMIIMGSPINTTEESMLRLVRQTYSGSKYSASVDFKMKSYASGDANARTQLTIGLKNGGGYGSGSDADIMTLRADGLVGVGTTLPLSKFDVLVSGTALTNADIVGTAGNFEGPTQTGQGSTLSLTGNDAVAANIGGVLGFGGNYNGTQYANWASIKGLKADATSGTYGGYLSFFTRLTGNSSSERMRIDTNGNVGIGTTAPASKLGVLGNASIGATYGAIAAPASSLIVEGNIGISTTSPSTKFNIATTSSNTWSHFYKNSTESDFVIGSINTYDPDVNLTTMVANGFDFKVNRTSSTTAALDGTSAMAILKNGNVSIGASTTSYYGLSINSDYKLSVDGSSSSNTGITSTGMYVSGDVVGLESHGSDYGISGIAGSGVGISGVGLTGAELYGTNYDLTAINASGKSYFAGKVGIGNTNPGAPLDVKITTNGDVAYLSGGVSNYKMVFGLDANGSYIYNNSSVRSLSLGVNSARDSLVIRSDGNVGVGTTNPGTKFEIGSSDLGGGGYVPGPVLTIGRNTNASLPAAGSINFMKKDGTAGYVWQDSAGNMRINSAPPMNAYDTSGTVIGAQTSTRNTKQDITDYTDYSDALSIVVNAPLHTFRYIKEVNGYGTDSPLAKAHLGFIADEVDPIFMWDGTIDQVSVNGLLMGSIKEMNLNLSALTGEIVPTAGSKEESFMNKFFANLYVKIGDWLGSADNGIKTIFARKVSTKLLCVTDEANAETCIVKSQLDNLLSGNAAGAVGTPSQVVTINPNAPVINLTGSSTINLNVGDTYGELGATATDNVDTFVSVSVAGTVDTAVQGTYTITYNAVDTDGNNAIEVTRTVVVNAVTTTPSGTTTTDTSSTATSSADSASTTTAPTTTTSTATTPTADPAPVVTTPVADPAPAI